MRVLVFSFVCSFCFFCVGAVPVFAQEIYYDKEQKALDEKLGVISPRTQKSGSLINEISEEYYKNCIKDKHPILTDLAAESMCLCTSAGLVEKMSLAEIQFMEEKDSTRGKKARQRMLDDVYAPCMEYPVRDTVYERCMEDIDFRKRAGKDADGICSCAADTIEAYTARDSKKFLAEIMEKNPETKNPMGDFLESDLFMGLNMKWIVHCARKYQHHRYIQKKNQP